MPSFRKSWMHVQPTTLMETTLFSSPLAAFRTSDETAETWRSEHKSGKITTRILQSIETKNLRCLVEDEDEGVIFSDHPCHPKSVLHTTSPTCRAFWIQNDTPVSEEICIEVEFTHAVTAMAFEAAYHAAQGIMGILHGMPVAVPQAGNTTTGNTPSRQLTGGIIDSSTKVVIDNIGELDINGLLKEANELGVSSTTIMFYYAVLSTSGGAVSRKRSRDERPFYIYRVDKQGKLDVVCEYSGDEDWSHCEENVYPGQSFAIFRAKALTGDFILNNLVLSYRILAALAPGQRHAVHISIPAAAHIEHVHQESRIRLLRTVPFLLPHSRAWTVTLEYRVPPLPPVPAHTSAAEFFESNSFGMQVDAKFLTPATIDGKHSKKQLPPCMMQPRVMCGRVRASHMEKTYEPIYKTISDAWIAQAQYVWGPYGNDDEEEDEDDDDAYERVICGNSINVGPGDVMVAVINYDGFSKLRISIKCADKKSEIVISNPYPDEVKLVPGGWKEFFEKKKDLQGNVAMSSVFDLNYVAEDMQGVVPAVLDGMCPVRIRSVTTECEGALSDSAPKSVVDVLRNSWKMDTINFMQAREGVAMVEFGAR